MKDEGGERESEREGISLTREIAMKPGIKFKYHTNKSQVEKYLLNVCFLSRS